MANTSQTFVTERLGRPIIGAEGGGLTIFSFGREATEVTTCAVTKEVVASDQMAMSSKDGKYISAQYRGVPAQCGFNLSSVLTGKPKISAG